MHLLIYPLALISALATLAICTPRQWWQRPTLLITALLIASTCAYAQALKTLLPQTPTQTPTPKTIETTQTIYRTKHSLNLRATPGTNAKKHSQIPAHQLVISTGEQHGDWWHIQSCNDATQSGWVNSLWLRRLDESPLTPEQQTQLAKCEIRKR